MNLLKQPKFSPISASELKERFEFIEEEDKPSNEEYDDYVPEDTSYEENVNDIVEPEVEEVRQEEDEPKEEVIEKVEPQDTVDDNTQIVPIIKKRG